MAHMCNLTGTNIAITHSCVEKTQMSAHLINYLPASRHLWSDHTHKLEVVREYKSISGSKNENTEIQYERNCQIECSLGSAAFAAFLSLFEHS